MNPDVKNKIEDLLKQHKIFLFMKGSPQFPQCGFSARAAGILNELNVDFGSFNVLEDENIREGIKEYGQWPTIPQLYHNGELIGGSDILMEMYESGELKQLFSNQ
ncbi:MAG: Grx4 family monothiol glutaredoxin [Bdellovibrionaceae bacterium]|nr:Grx4 family monothiol glutaredoxin [Pseudobdellovibrionaceae bacterium]